MTGDGLEGDGGEGGGGLEGSGGGGVVDGGVAVEVGGERGGGVGADGGARDGAERRRFLLRVDFGGGDQAGLVGSDVAEGMTQVLDWVGYDHRHVFPTAEPVITAGEADADFAQSVAHRRKKLYIYIDIKKRIILSALKTILEISWQRRLCEREKRVERE